MPLRGRIVSWKCGLGQVRVMSHLRSIPRSARVRWLRRGEGPRYRRWEDAGMARVEDRMSLMSLIVAQDLTVRLRLAAAGGAGACVEK